VNVPQAALATSSTYYGRVKYATTNTTATTSSFSAWSKFGTAASFVPAAGSAMNGGYFGGQINDGGIIYNLIVGPVATAQNGGATPTGIQYKTTATGDSPPATFQNLVYGFPASQAGNDANHPAFQFARGLSIAGYSDWYIPALNELSTIYYFLKPTTTTNNTSSGSNANAVSPQPVSTNYTGGDPAKTTSTLFQSGGSEAFVAATYYWTSSENAGSTTNAYAQNFIDGNQLGTFGKDYTLGIGIDARAIRREYANAPVAIGASFGGGYFAGQYVDGGVTYNLIVAPKATGQYNPSGTNPDQIQYKTSASSDAPSATFQNEVYGAGATTAGNDASHPMFQWAKGLTIATLSDWYIPAKNELNILYYNLGPSFTTATAFQAGGTEAFATASNGYWSSTEYSSDSTKAWGQNFINGGQGFSVKTYADNARVVRRVAA